MAERIFEMELDRLFAQAPAMPDADNFASRIGERLDRGWTVRRVVIGGLGIAGGLIGGAQIFGSGLVSRLAEVKEQSGDLASDMSRAMASELVSSPLSQWAGSHGLAGLLATGSSMNGEILWMSAALAILAVGLFVTRALRDF